MAIRQVIEQDENELARKSAQHIADVITRTVAEKGHATIGLATGSTPIKTYEELVKLYKAHKVSFKNVTTFNLDEYIVDSDKERGFFTNPNSYHGFMEEHLFRHIADGTANGMDRSKINIPDTRVSDYKRIVNGDFSELKPICDAYEEKIKEAGGIDLQVVGIGANGHLGFCEPGSNPNGRTSVQKLTKKTVDDNMQLFNFAAPYAVSMGLGTIRDAREIILLAKGDGKAPVLHKIGEAAARRTMSPADERRNLMQEIVAAKKEGAPVAPKIPALMLLGHPNVTAYLDTKAAAKMGPSGLSA